MYKAVTFGYEVAVKEIVTKSYRISENDFLRFKQDVKVMSTVHHPNSTLQLILSNFQVCLFLGACLDAERCILVTELCQQDLQEVLNDKKVFLELGLFEKLEMAKDIASGFVFMIEYPIL